MTWFLALKLLVLGSTATIVGREPMTQAQCEALVESATLAMSKNGVGFTCVEVR
jgi:uncharacterized protein YejL (UPF0352 family)